MGSCFLSCSSERWPRSRWGRGGRRPRLILSLALVYLLFTYQSAIDSTPSNPFMVINLHLRRETVRTLLFLQLLLAQVEQCVEGANHSITHIHHTCPPCLSCCREMQSVGSVLSGGVHTHAHTHTNTWMCSAEAHDWLHCQPYKCSTLHK